MAYIKGGFQRMKIQTTIPSVYVRLEERYIKREILYFSGEISSEPHLVGGKRKREML